MKRIILLFIAAIFIFSLSASAKPATLEKVRLGKLSNKLRIIFNFSAQFNYSVSTAEGQNKLVITVPGVRAGSKIETYIDFNTNLVNYAEIERDGDGLKIAIAFEEKVPFKVFKLGFPDRLVVDFAREYTNIIPGETLIDGLERLEVINVLKNGKIHSNILKIDLHKVDIAPALAKKKKPSVLESFISILNPWKGSDAAKSFYRARVSSIAEDEGAVAAVNGSFFSYSGRPLGTLLIDKELVSSPIFGRTAFIISDDQKAFIDNITLDCYFLTANKVCYTITGINQSRDNNAIILYTPLWGKKTGTATNGIELVVSKGQVKEIKAGNSNIPTDGYVISFIGSESQFVSDNIKVGETLNLKLNVVPFATSPNGVTHIISGGPRLVKQGTIYVAKHEEKFKADVGSARAARTAIGITRDGSVILAVVDGRPRKKALRNDNSSLGMTLEELAGLMRKLGAYDAMNLDGGSSSTMWAKDRLMNVPVTGYESGVSNAIVLRPKI